MKAFQTGLGWDKGLALWVSSLLKTQLVNPSFICLPSW